MREELPVVTILKRMEAVGEAAKEFAALADAVEALLQ
jgi:hypothetical protein